MLSILQEKHQLSTGMIFALFYSESDSKQLYQLKGGNKMSEGKRLSFGKAMFLLVISILLIIIGKTILKGDTSVVLLLDAAIVSAFAMLWGVKWEDIQNHILENIKSMTVPIMILMCVGMLVGVWMLSGTIPTMIYYGMKFLKPNMFLIMTCLIACLMSLMTGTSWGTVSTVGVALIGVSMGLGIPVQYTAGAITVGAIFGDKLSPLSDTTVLSSAVAEVDIIDHIKYMLYNTVPCLIISLVLYAILGFNYNSGSIQGAEYNVMLETLHQTFNINPILLLPPIVILALIVMKKPTVPTFFAGIITGFVLAIIFQGSSLSETIGSLASGYKTSTGVEIVDAMVLRGGMNSMLSTIIMVISAGIFGAPLKATGAVQIIIDRLDTIVKNEKQMMLAVGALHLILFVVVVSYYVSFVIVGNMTKGLFDKYKVSRVNLSRTLEDTGTAFAPLIPWGLSGAFYSSTLGVPSTQFAIYAPITYLSFIIGAIYIITGFKIARTEDKDVELSQI